MKLIWTVLQEFRVQKDFYPETLDALEVYFSEKQSGRLQEIELPKKDPWGRDYIYEHDSSESFTVKCYGRNGREGGTGENRDYIVRGKPLGDFESTFSD